MFKIALLKTTIFKVARLKAATLRTALLLLLIFFTNLSQAELKPFTASYTTQWKMGWFTIDIDAQRKLEKLNDHRWQMVFQAETSAAKLVEKSIFKLSAEQRIQPLDYQYRASGLFNEPDRTLSFLPQQHTIQDLENSLTYEAAWQEEIHDNLSYMLQAGLDLAAGHTEFTYPVFEKSKNKPFRFRVIGEEELKTPEGTLQTVKVQQIRRKKDREIFAWFAKDKNFLLVKLQDKKKGKTRYEIKIKSIKM